MRKEGPLVPQLGLQRVQILRQGRTVLVQLIPGAVVPDWESGRGLMGSVRLPVGVASVSVFGYDQRQNYSVVVCTLPRPWPGIVVSSVIASRAC